MLNRDEKEKIVKHMLIAIGEDPEREGLINTPSRVVRSWEKLFGGYKEDPEKILATSFTEGACNEMVVLKDVEFYSMCEHHILPFFGKIHIGYIPNGKVVGISKLARVVEVFARRVQIQERMTQQISDCIMKILQPKGVIVICEAGHHCMKSRGIEKQNSVMITSAIKGVFENVEMENKFINLIKM